MVSKSTVKSKSVSPAISEKKTVVGKTSKGSIENKDNRIYIRYRHRKLPTRDEIRLLHPSIIDVRFPRQKSAKFCTLEFEDKKAAITAFKKIMKTHKEELSSIQYLGKRRTQSESGLPSKMSDAQDQSEDDSSDEQEDTEEETSNAEEQCAEKSTPSKNQSCACLHVSGLPDFAVKEVLQSLYPSNTKLEISDKKLKGKRYALVHFESAEEATRVMKASKNVNVNGDKLTVKFHK